MVRSTVLEATPKQAQTRSSPGIQRCYIVSKKVTVSLQTGDSSILSKSKNGCSGDRVRVHRYSNREAKIRPVEHRGQRVDLREPHDSTNSSVLEKMNKSLETCIQAGKKLLRRAEEALMKLTSHGYRQVPLKLVNGNDALTALDTTPAKVKDTEE